MAKYLMQIVPPGAVVPSQESYNPQVWTLVAGGATGPVSAFFGRVRAGRQARTLRAMTETMQAAKAYFDAQREAIESCMKAQEQGYRLQTLPLRSGYEQEQQAREQWEGLRALEHRSVVGEHTRGGELAEAEASLVGAQQARDAQRNLGAELASKKRQVDLLDVELALAERRAILRQHLEELGRAAGAAGMDGTSAIEDALYDARAQLYANGLDTSAIDAILQRRNRR